MISLSCADIKKHLNLFLLYLLYCGAFLYFCYPSMGRPLLNLFLIVSMLCMLWHLPKIWRSPVFLLVVASVLIQIASWIYCKQNFALYAESTPDFKRLGHLFLFLPVAWILKSNNRSPWVLMTLFFVGLCFTPFTIGGGFEDFFNGKRSAFGFRNAEHAALMFAISLVALVVFRNRFFECYRHSRTKVLVIFSMAMIYSVAIVAISNTRGVFLGLFAGILTVGAGMLRQNLKPKKREMLVALALAMVMAVSLSMTSNPLAKWLNEVETVKLLVSGSTSSIPNDTSSGIRIHSWIEGWKWFSRSPLVGWGENGKELAIKESTALPESVRNEFGHLHNSYLETLVNNGILGIALLFALHAWIGVTVVKGCRKRGIRDVQVFSLVAGVLWLTANFFESFVFYRTGVMMFGIGSASLLTASGYNFGVSSPNALNEHQS